MKVTVLVIMRDGDLTVSVHKKPRGAYASAIVYYAAADGLEESYPGDWRRLYAEWVRTADEGTEASLWEMIQEYARECQGDVAEIFEDEEVVQ